MMQHERASITLVLQIPLRLHARFPPRPPRANTLLNEKPVVNRINLDHSDEIALSVLRREPAPSIYYSDGRLAESRTLN
jgi:hypothetical protein